MHRPLSLTVALLAVTAGLATVLGQDHRITLYLVSTAHLDSQWNWTVQDSIRQFVPDTFRTNNAFIKKYPNYKFTWEGAIHYMWFKEYYPEEWAEVQKYVAENRWLLAGSWINAVDTNMPSPESLFRQTLYAQRFFRQEFQKVPRDIFLPDWLAANIARTRSRKLRAVPAPTLNSPLTRGLSSSQSIAATQSSTCTKSRICSPSAMPGRSERNSRAAPPCETSWNLWNTTLAMRPLWYSFGP